MADGQDGGGYLPSSGADKLANPSGVASGAGAGFTGFLQQNPALAAGIGVGASTLPLLLNKGNNLPYGQNIQGIGQQAASLYGSQGTYAGQLEQPIVTGQLPPGAKAQVDIAQKKADTQIKQRYASLGLTGSTMEADQLAQNEQNRAALEFEIEKNMADLGLRAGQQALDALKLEDSVYSELMKAQMLQDKGMTDAIGGFAKAAGTALGMVGGGIIGGPVGAAAGGALGGAAGGAIASGGFGGDSSGATDSLAAGEAGSSYGGFGIG